MTDECGVEDPPTEEERRQFEGILNRALHNARRRNISEGEQ